MMCCVLTSLGKHGEGEAAAVGVPLLQDGKARRALDPRVRRDVVRDRALVGHVAERGEVLTLAEWVDLVAPRARTVAGVTHACKRVLTACVRSRASPIASLFGRDESHKASEKRVFRVDRPRRRRQNRQYIYFSQVTCQNSLPPFNFHGGAIRGPFRRGGGAACIHTGICGKGA